VSGSSTSNESEWRTPSTLWRRLKPIAREIRHFPTAAEDVLWQALRRHELGGLHFRRQHPIGSYIVDFYCAKAKLVIEFDGPIHLSQVEEDANRDDFLVTTGLRVLRFTNDRVLEAIDGVIDEVRNALNLSPDLLRRSSPSPWTERGTGEGEVSGAPP
jgi:very-short-patch-repair endonuclease